MKVYLDVCCLNRPFDDPASVRVSIESAAVMRILDETENGRLIDFSSDMARIEIERIPDPQRRRWILALLPPAARILSLTEEILDSAGVLMDIGFSLADAVHLVAARHLAVDVFLSVDDKLLKRAKKYPRRLNIRVLSPVDFVQEL